jgi:LysR family transcriptional regulator, benzoate and cis,cis-muconate-responsive activator of ben and cat genes
VGLNRIELRHLRYFVGVVEQKSFHAAAQRLHISQPSITRQVQQLEDTLGVKLFIRKPRGIELTQAGSVFYRDARTVLGLVEQGAARARLAGDGKTGRLDVGIFGSAVFGAIPAVLHEFRRAVPMAEVVLHNLDRGAQIAALQERRLDVGFNRFFADVPGLRWEVIQTEGLNVALPRLHPLAKRKHLTIKDLHAAPLILYPRSPRPSFIDYMLQLFFKSGVKPTVIHEVDEVATAASLVASGFGLSVVSDSACNLRLPGIRYVPLVNLPQTERQNTGTPGMELCVIYRPEDASPLLDRFLSIARAVGTDSAARPRKVRK